MVIDNATASEAKVTDPDGPDSETLVRMMEKMPKEVGVLLLSVGAMGMVLPGMVGIPAVIAGGIVCWPKAFKPLDRWIGRKFPAVHGKSLDQISRYLGDLERRYPTQSDESVSMPEGG